jgi:hypothetical protein
VRRARVVLLAAVVLAGCGGGDKPADPKAEHQRGGEEAERHGGEEAERERAVRGVRPADLTAFYQVATATGALRKWAAHRRLGMIGLEADRSELDGALSRLREVKPVDPELSAAYRRALAALHRAWARRRPTRADGSRGQADAEDLSARINRIVRSDPRFSALMPD